MKEKTTAKQILATADAWGLGGIDFWHTAFIRVELCQLLYNISFSGRKCA